jgi:hypothetical protein
MGEMVNEYIIIGGKLERKRLLRKTKTRWNDGIKMDLKEKSVRF